MYLDRSLFDSFFNPLEANWQTIEHELRQLSPHDFIPYPERYLLHRKTGWDTFGLYFLGVKIDLNCELCPATTKLLEQVPGLITAGFSRLAPGARILPHSGKPAGVLRCHLGLSVPNNCALRVGPDIKTWVNGQCLIFDDTSEHEAWNLSSQHRDVLLLDFKTPAFIKAA